MKKLNPIAIWSKFKDYGNWCYRYRIPNESEFVPGFEFEYITYMYTRLKDGSTKPFLDIDYDIVPVSWEKRVVLDVIDKYFIWSLIPIRYGIQYKLPQHHLQSYLEEGHIRVKKTDERKDSINNIQSNIMKLFYYELGLRKGIEFNEKGKIKQLGSTALREGQFKYAVALAENPNEGFDQIIKQFGIKNDPMGELHKVLHGYDKQYGYYMIHSGGHELTISEFDKIHCFANEVLNTVEATTEFIKLFTKKQREDKLIKPKKGFKDKWVNRIKPNLKAFTNLITKLTNICKNITPIVIKIEPNERYLGKEQGWAPILKPVYHQLEKSPNRLVCIATKDRLDFKRMPWIEANKLIEDAQPETPYEFISKEEFRKLSAPKPGLSLIPHNMDKSYKLIPIEVPREEKDILYTRTVNENGEEKLELFSDKKWINKVVFDEGADNKYHRYKPDIPNKSSSKVAKCKRKSKHHQQGVKKIKFSNKYEISFFRQQKEGSAEFVYQQFAKTEDQAIYKAGVRLEAEGADLAYFKPKVKLLEQGSSKISTKKDSLTKLVILPKILDLPIWKNKNGKVIPWTKKVSQITTEQERAEGGGIFKMIDQEITTYNKYEIGYERFDQSFKKTPKKWKCPTAKDKNYNHPKKSRIIKRHNKK